jgi:hypothetical protein
MVKPTISGNRAQKITTKKTLKKIAKHPLTTQSRFNSTTEPPDQPATQSDAKQRFLQMIDPDRPIKAPTTPQSTTGPFRGASRELDDDIPLEQSNVNANIVTRRLVAQFPHPIFPTPTEQERSSPLYRRFKGERETWATNPNCKANVRPSWTNYKSYETWKRLKEYCTKGQSRELADFLSKPQNKNVLNLNAQDYFGSTMLCTASKLHYYGIVSTLLQHGADPNFCSISGPPLFHATSTLDIPIIRLLIEYGAHINYQSPSTGQSALMVAASVTNSAYPLFLLENGADVNLKDSNGRTALMYAASKSTQPICAILLENGAKFDDVDAVGLGPIDYALKRPKNDNQRKGIIDLLEAFKIDAPKNAKNAHNNAARGDLLGHGGDSKGTKM